MDTDFTTDPKLASVRDALAVTGLPVIPVKVISELPAEDAADPPAGLLGCYNQETNTLWVADDSSDERELVATHEYGHAVWFHGIRTKDKVLNAKIAKVMQAINRSSEVKAFQAEAKKQISEDLPSLLGLLDHDDPDDEVDGGDDNWSDDPDGDDDGFGDDDDAFAAATTKKKEEDKSDPLENVDCSYVLEPTEEWARAFAQYVFTKPDQKPVYRTAWDHFYNDPKNADYSLDQWSEKDFAPIRAEFDQQFPTNHNQ